MCFVNATSLSTIHRKHLKRMRDNAISMYLSPCGFSWEQKGVIVVFDCFELFQLFAFLFFACKT